MLKSSDEYRAIAAHYGDRRARRSGVLLMNHIDEGLAIMESRNASEIAQRAFCLHPLLQDDASLVASWPRLHELSSDARVIALAFEYRNIANAALSHRTYASSADIQLSPLPEVNEMLVADKVQNYKDFRQYHLGTHPRSDALDRYFRLWLDRLGFAQ